MKTLAPLLSGLCVLLTAGCVGAETVYYERPVPVIVAPPQPPPPPAEAMAPSTATVVQTVSVPVQPLDQLVAPIALYPDPLLALLLPASTMSSDVVLAARYFAAGGDPQQVDGQPWDESVKGLAHYPEVVKWLDENLAWTQQLGAAYMESPDNVMAAVQRVRAQARAKGLLLDGPQQQVVVDGDTLAIVPAQPDVIYVPRYDPEVIFVDRPVIYANDPWLTFGMGFGVGWWLSYDFDWHRRSIWIDRHSRDRWRDRHEWRQPHFPGGGRAPRGPEWQPWRPAPGRPQPPHRDVDRDRHRPAPHPTPMPGAPHRDRDRDRHDQPPRGPGGSPQPHAPADNPRAHSDRPNNPPHIQPPRADRVPQPARPAPNQPNRRDRDNRRPDPQANPGAPAQRPDRAEHDAPAHPAPAARPQDRPRLAPPLGAPADRVPPATQPRQPQRSNAPAADRSPGRAQPDERRAAPAPVAPRQDRTDRTDRAPRTEPAARSKPAEDGNRNPAERDNHQNRDAER